MAGTMERLRGMTVLLLVTLALAILPTSFAFADELHAAQQLEAQAADTVEFISGDLGGITLESGKTYYVCTDNGLANPFVKTGETLTIEAGATLKFGRNLGSLEVGAEGRHPASGILVYEGATVIAQGTADAHITFAPMDFSESYFTGEGVLHPSEAEVAWGGFRFLNLPIDEYGYTTHDASAARNAAFEYCDFLGSGIVSDGGNWADGNTIWLWDTGDDTTLADADTVTLQNCTFDNSALVESGWNTNGILGNAVFIDDEHGTGNVTIDNCIFNQIGRAVISEEIDEHTPSKHTLTFTNNEFIARDYDSNDTTAIVWKGSDASVANSSFDYTSGNALKVPAVSLLSPGVTYAIGGNTFAMGEHAVAAVQTNINANVSSGDTGNTVEGSGNYYNLIETVSPITGDGYDTTLGEVEGFTYNLKGHAAKSTVHLTPGLTYYGTVNNNYGGTFVAEGTADQHITLHGFNLDSYSGLDSMTLGSSGSASFAYCDMDGYAITTGGSETPANNSFDRCTLDDCYFKDIYRASGNGKAFGLSITNSSLRGGDRTNNVYALAMIYVEENSSGTDVTDSLVLQNVLIAGYTNTSGLYFEGHAADTDNIRIQNVTITGCKTGLTFYGAAPTMTSCIIAGNTTDVSAGSGATAADVIYSCIPGTISGSSFASLFTGTGNISADPLFVGDGDGDYHLQSTGGHYVAGSWVADAQTSPCIDAGDPSAAYASEPDPNGGRINMGAYGNTAEASKTGSGQVVTTSIAVPVAATGLVYNGKAQAGVTGGTGYTLSGTALATNAGSYIAKASLKDGYIWSDGTTSDKTVRWSIAKATNAITVSTAAVTKTGNVSKAVTFTRKATAKGGAVTYKSSITAVKVTSAGKVTIPKNWTGAVKITASCSGNANYNAAAAKSYTIKVKPGKVTVKKAINVKGRKIKVTWTKMTGADKCQVQIAQNKGFSKGKKTYRAKGSATSKTIGKLKAGKTYHVRIRAYDAQTQSWGAWSVPKKVQVNK